MSNLARKPVWMASLKTATAQDRALEEEAKIELSYHSVVCHITAWDSHLRASDDGEGEVLPVMTYQ